jgi:tetratricopeptide (TPR) repeat protein
MSIGEIYAATGRAREAAAIATTLLARVAPDARAFGSVLQAQLALASGNAVEARDLLTKARTVSDAWLIRFWLGRAYLAMNMYAEADSEFEACLQRRGEAAAVLMDDFPTFTRWLDVYYYQGVTREGLKSAGAIDSFKTFLAPKDNGDETVGLVADARKRIAGR